MQKFRPKPDFPEVMQEVRVFDFYRAMSKCFGSHWQRDESINSTTVAYSSTRVLHTQLDKPKACGRQLAESMRKWSHRLADSDFAREVTKQMQFRITKV